MSSSSPNFKDRFSQVAGGYASYRPRYPAALVDYLANLIVRPMDGSNDAILWHSWAWDCGCGSGQLSVPLAARFGKVSATDASAEQIAQATPHPRVEYRIATAESSGLTDASVDLITVAQAVHWFDRSRFYNEARRVCRPGAVLALICYGIHTVDRAIDPIVRLYYREMLAPYWGPERRHVETGYRDFDFPFDELPAPPMELTADWTLPQMIGYIETWSATWAMVKEYGRGPLEHVCKGLARVWGDPAAIRTMRWPLSMRIGRV